jgi:hypothetical protein
MQRSGRIEPAGHYRALGGGVIKSEIISRTRRECYTAERIVAAVELARCYPGARVVFAGWVECDFVLRLLEKLGMSKDRVIVELAQHRRERGIS